MLSCCRLPENFITRPSPVRNMHFEGPQNINQMRSPFMKKEKFVHQLNTIYNLDNIDHNHSAKTAR